MPHRRRASACPATRSRTAGSTLAGTRRPGVRPRRVKCAFCKEKQYHARIAIPAHDPEGGARRGGARQPPADASCRHDQAPRGGNLHVAAAGRARSPQGRGDRARGNESIGRHRTADAGGATRGAVAGERPLGKIRTGAPAPQGPPRARLHRPADIGRGHHGHRAQGAQELQATADQPVSHPDQVSRRSAAALRRDALARVRHEGCVFLRRRQGGDAEVVPVDVRRV